MRFEIGTILKERRKYQYAEVRMYKNNLGDHSDCGYRVKNLTLAPGAAEPHHGIASCPPHLHLNVFLAAWL